MTYFTTQSRSIRLTRTATPICLNQTLVPVSVKLEMMVVTDASTPMAELQIAGADGQPIVLFPGAVAPPVNDYAPDFDYEARSACRLVRTLSTTQVIRALATGY